MTDAQKAALSAAGWHVSEHLMAAERRNETGWAQVWWWRDDREWSLRGTSMALIAEAVRLLSEEE